MASLTPRMHWTLHDYELDTEHSKVLDSISLNNWLELMEYKERHGDDLTAKSLAELGFLGNGLLSLLETGVRLPICFVVGNSISKRIAQTVNFLKQDEDETLAKYLLLRRRLNRGFAKSVESVSQNFASVGTNLGSHDLQNKTASKIGSVVTEKTEYGVSFFENILSPLTIVKTVRGIPPSGPDMLNLMRAEQGEVRKIKGGNTKALL